MKKINLVIACLLGTALTLGGCASTPQSEAYLATPIGDGSESGFAMTTTLPDGTVNRKRSFFISSGTASIQRIPKMIV